MYLVTLVAIAVEPPSTFVRIVCLFFSCFFEGQLVESAWACPAVQRLNNLRVVVMDVRQNLVVLHADLLIICRIMFEITRHHSLYRGCTFYSYVNRTYVYTACSCRSAYQGN